MQSVLKSASGLEALHPSIEALRPSVEALRPSVEALRPSVEALRLTPSTRDVFYSASPIQIDRCECERLAGCDEADGALRPGARPNRSALLAEPDDRTGRSASLAPRRVSFTLGTLPASSKHA